MPINGFQKTTLLDYPGKVACTVFLGGCNFRCPFCHNGELVLNFNDAPTISEETVFAHLKRRQGILEGVCITGGEPCLQPGLTEFIKKIRELGFLVKLDTNGYYPEQLKDLIQAGLIDYVAMDIKHSPEKYNFISQMHGFDITRIQESVSLLLEGSVPYEFRTTVVKELHQEEDFPAIGEWLSGANAYYLQSYKDSEHVISPGFSAYSYAGLKRLLAVLLPFIPNTQIRGVDEA